jgi:Fe2+ or Zn2+ uptake regulation protein
VELSHCCGVPVCFTSYSVDYKAFPKNRGKEDHFTCEKCGKPCKVVDEDGQLVMEEMLWTE